MLSPWRAPAGLGGVSPGAGQLQVPRAIQDPDPSLPLAGGTCWCGHARHYEGAGQLLMRGL